MNTDNGSHSIRGLCRSIATGIFAVGIATSVHAQDFNIDFGNYHGAPTAGFGAAADQVGHWNLVTSSQFLENLSGEATSAHLTSSFYAAGSWIDGNSGEVAALLDDSFYSLSGSAWALTFTGLTDGFYNLVYYAPAHLSIVTGAFTANGVSAVSLPGVYGGGFVEGQSWGSLTNVLVSNGELTLLNTSTDGLRGLSGLQLQYAAVPEPSAYAAILGGLVLFGAWLRRRLKK